MRITAAGTVPDSHRIPLHRGGIGHQIAFYGCKGTKKRANIKIKSRFSFVFLCKRTFDDSKKNE